MDLILIRYVILISFYFLVLFFYTKYAVKLLVYLGTELITAFHKGAMLQAMLQKEINSNGEERGTQKDKT